VAGQHQIGGWLPIFVSNESMELADMISSMDNACSAGAGVSVQGRVGTIVRPASRTRYVAGAVAALLCFAVPCDAYQTPLDAKALHDAYVLGQRNDQSTGDFLAPYIKEMSESRSDLHVAEIEILTPFAQAVDDSRKNTAGYSEQQAVQKYQQAGNTVLVNVTLMLPEVYAQAANNNGKDNPAGTGPAAVASASGVGTPPSEAASGSAQASAPDGETTKPGATKASAAKPLDTKPGAEAQGNSNLRPENFWQSFQFYFKQNGKNIPSKALHDKPIYSTATKETPSVLDGATVWMEFDAKDVAAQETMIEVVTPDGKTISATFDLKKLR
jgi:hypothetical protein